MNINEFSDQYDVLLASYLRFKKFDPQKILDSVEINEYEKSLYLTKAQNEIVTELYTGKSIFQESYEQTEQLRRYLADLNTSEVISTFIPSTAGIATGSKTCKIEGDLLYITHEACKVELSNSLCDGQEVIMACTPISRDEYNSTKDNPFKNNKVWRVDQDYNTVELISKHNIKEYRVSYLRTPSPIILEDIYPYTINGESDESDSRLHPILHEYILERAVQNTLRDIIKTQPQETN
jgi:hypothetical protein